jgi:hypothetical protein
MDQLQKIYAVYITSSHPRILLPTYTRRTGHNTFLRIPSSLPPSPPPPTPTPTHTHIHTDTHTRPPPSLTRQICGTPDCNGQTLSLFLSLSLTLSLAGHMLEERTWPISLVRAFCHSGRECVYERECVCERERERVIERSLDSCPLGWKCDPKKLPSLKLVSSIQPRLPSFFPHFPYYYIHYNHH